MLRIVLLFVAALVFWIPAARAISSPADFTRAYVNVLKKKAPGVEVRIIADLELRLIEKSKDERTVFLHNAYDAYKQNSANGHEVIERYVGAILSPDPVANTSVDRHRIVPIIKDRAWIQETSSALKARGADTRKIDHVWDEYNRDLVILYAEDSPKAIRYLTPGDIDKLGINRTELRSLAVANLRTVIPKIELRGTPEIYMMTAGGDYEASLLLDGAIWTGGQIKVDGEIVVAVPSRDMLLITGSNSHAGIAKAKKIAEETAKTAPYRLTSQLFVFRDGKFVTFTK